MEHRAPTHSSQKQAGHGGRCNRWARRLECFVCMPIRIIWTV